MEESIIDIEQLFDDLQYERTIDLFTGTNKCYDDNAGMIVQMSEGLIWEPHYRAIRDIIRGL